jgi:hypothetical protein
MSNSEETTYALAKALDNYCRAHPEIAFVRVQFCALVGEVLREMRFDPPVDEDGEPSCITFEHPEMRNRGEVA